MTLLVKDHKSWDLIPKTRSVMGGNEGGNKGISEFLSLVLEPVAREQNGSMEINATNGLLADIFDLNEELEEETAENPNTEETSNTQPARRGGVLDHQVESSIHVEDETVNPTTVEECSPSNEVPSIHEEECQEVAKMGPISATKIQSDIRQFLKAGGPKPSFVKTVPDKVDEPFDKMRMIRNKMAEARRAAERDEAM